MKRDMELIRLLLLRTESGGDYIAEAEKYDVPTRAYHVALMKEAGLVEANVQLDETGLPSAARIVRLTSQGHDALDALRDDTVWKRTKDKFLKPTGTFILTTVVEWAKAEARRIAFGDGHASGSV